ncbi:MAG: UDP-N-acetylglucosamine 2-epimerase (non-hydrolyzing) [Bacteroidetes bacterium]|nr:UDP-N-acetylglucosamine 2-epimerase (non-hydrolyzing) [Bacteroidota bacterium]
MIQLVTIIGARPQIIKAAALSRAIKQAFSTEINEVLVHTGQHYDENMSEVFFSELGIPQPDYRLNVGSGSHGKQTAAMISSIEEVLLERKPDALVVYGDTNSTLAGAVAASKLHIPVVHIEAGLRSFNKKMPEEVNRILCDHVSSFLFTPTQTGYQNLINEGLTRHMDAILAGKQHVSADAPAVFHCGDVMYDNSLYFASLAESKSRLLEEINVKPGGFILATVHRDSNTDVPERLTALFDAFFELILKTGMKIVLPLHPRTRKNIAALAALEARIAAEPRLILLPPVSFLEMILLEKNCRLVLTDSGGVQKEAYFFEKACVILRPETEWVELTQTGSAKLADANTELIVNSALTFLQGNYSFPPVFGDGKAAAFICSELIKYLAR